MMNDWIIYLGILPNGTGSDAAHFTDDAFHSDSFWSAILVAV